MQRGWLWNDKAWEHAELLDYAAAYPNEFPFTPDMLDAMFNHADRVRDYLSPTGLGQCARKDVLERLGLPESAALTARIQAENLDTDYYEDVFKAYAKWRGTMAHAFLEGGPNEPDAILEQSREKWIDVPGYGPYLLKGKPDKLVPRRDKPGEWLLIDYKTVKTIEKKAKNSWVQQLSCYKWMCSPELNITRAVIQQFNMATPARLELDLWSIEDTETWIRARLPEFIRSRRGEVTIETLPRLLLFGIDDTAHLCASWCPVGPLCRALSTKGY